MVSASQRLREQRARQLQQKSLQARRQRDIQAQQRALRGLKPVRKPVAPLPPTPQQLKAEAYKKEYTQTISTLEKERKGISDKLSRLNKEKADLIKQKKAEGSYGSDISRAISQKYKALRIPLQSKIQAYNVTIQLAKTKGVSNLRQLKSYTVRSAEISEQQQKATLHY